MFVADIFLVNGCFLGKQCVLLLPSIQILVLSCLVLIWLKMAIGKFPDLLPLLIDSCIPFTNSMVSIGDTGWPNPMRWVVCNHKFEVWFIRFHSALILDIRAAQDVLNASSHDIWRRTGLPLALLAYLRTLSFRPILRNPYFKEPKLEGFSCAFSLISKWFSGPKREGCQLLLTFAVRVPLLGENLPVNY